MSTNVDDRRRGRIPGGAGAGLGCGGILVVAILALVFGADPQQLLDVLSQAEQASVDSGSATDAGLAVDDEASQFMRAVLASTEDTWAEIFRTSGRRYQQPTLVLFSGRVASACGFASAAAGPFYCPADQKLYLDTAFFDELARRFGAPGDFAQAYVVAHEVGHHVQNLLGISGQVSTAQQRASRGEANQLSVRLELMADCLAGVWGHYAHRQGMLEPGDAEEGLRAAAAIGDDNIQRQSQGYVVPESFTHGSAEQRVSWLRLGLETGNTDSCETFGR